MFLLMKNRKTKYLQWSAIIGGDNGYYMISLDDDAKQAVVTYGCRRKSIAGYKTREEVDIHNSTVLVGVWDVEDRRKLLAEPVTWLTSKNTSTSWRCP